MTRGTARLSWLIAGFIAALTAASWSGARPGATFTIHWGPDGTADGFAGREALLFVPLIGVAVAALVALAIRFDPRRDNIVRSARAVGVSVAAILALLAAVQLAIAASGYGIFVPMDRLAPVAIGALIAVIGSVMPQIRRNYTVGVRLPWTIESEAAWDAAHRVAGRAWLATGTATVLVGAVIGGAPAIAVLLLGLVGSLPGVAFVAYRTWRGDPRRAREGGR